VATTAVEQAAAAAAMMATLPVEPAFAPPPGLPVIAPVTAPIAVVSEEPAEVAIPVAASAASVSAPPAPETLSAGEVEPQAAPETVTEPEPQRVPTQEVPMPEVAPAAMPKPAFDWEQLVGVKLFSWIAGVALALAGIFFVKYGVDHGWVTAPVRMALGLAVGVGLLLICERKFAGQYRTTANALDGAGVAILYATLFAAHDTWHLIPQAASFAAMVGVTVVAVVLSIRRDSVFIALLGLLGGFSTPALLSTGDDRPFSLFGYLLLLNAGIGWVAYKKKWPLLSLLTLVFTTLYQWVWVVRFLDGARVGLAAAIFLLFPIVAVMALWLAGRKDGDPPGALFERTAQMSAVLPLGFAIYSAAVGGYADKFAILFGFLFCVDAGLAVIAAWRRDAEALHLFGGATTILVFAVWSGFSYRDFAWPSIVGWVAAFVLLYALAPAVVALFGRGYAGMGRHAMLAAPALLFMFTVLSEIELRAVDPRLLFGALFALTALLAVVAARRDSGAMWLVAGFFAVTAQLSWSGGYLVESNVGTATILHCAFALLFLAVPLLARLARKPLATSSAAAIPALLQVVVMGLATREGLAPHTLGMIATVVAISIVAVALVSWQRRRYAAMFFAVLASWCVLAFWWGNSDLQIEAGRAIAAMLGLAALSLGASVWLNHERADFETKDASPYIVLSGFVFMMVIAGNATLAQPDGRVIWPLVALALMFAATSLASRLGLLALGAGILGEITVGIWIDTVKQPPSVERGAVLAVALTALAALVFGARREESGAYRSSLAFGAVLTALVAQIVLISSGDLPGRPSLPLILVAHVVVLLCVLAVTWVTEWYAIAVFAVIPVTAAMFVWRGDAFDPATWGGSMVLGLVLYLVLALYPLALKESNRGRIEPYIASIAISVTYFIFAKQSLEWTHFGAMGLLPVAQAGLLAFLLDRLARREPDDQPASGTRAMVAAAVLAFVTLAVPVQLDKEFVTIAWALEVAALVWLLGKLKHPGLLAWAAGLAVVVFVRLAANPAVLDYHPRSETLIFNWYLYTYFVPAAAFFVASWLGGKTGLEWPWLRRFEAALNAGGAILLFLLLNIEIADYYSTGDSITFDFDAGLAQDLTYTLGWVVYAVAMLVVGIVKRNHAARIAALGLLVVAILKCFLHDLMRLGGLYRVASLVGLALALAFVAVLLQKFVLRKEPAEG
jgi:uncharacterized membrane protein